MWADAEIVSTSMPMQSSASPPRIIFVWALEG
jgi:hypothetical protein